jgi:hypothetical protein
MIVSSPIGDMPFTPERVSVRGGVLILHGSMGAWPSQVTMTAADVANAARLLAPRTRRGWVIPLVGLGLAGVVPRLRRRR